MPITVLIADDSPFMLKLLQDTLKTDPNLKIIGVAKRGVECITQVITKRPRVVILDIMLPDESGLNIVYQIMRARPTAVVLFSSLTAEKVKQDSLVFNYGIVDFVSKPPAEVDDPIKFLRKTLLPKVHTLAKLNIFKFKTLISSTNDEFLGRVTKQPATVVQEKIEERIDIPHRIHNVIVIGASTGGPGALTELLPRLPPTIPPILIVQHMPAGFIESFAQRLNQISQIEVVPAVEGLDLKRGHAYIAQGGKHMELKKNHRGTIEITLTDGPLVNFVKPSVDVTLNSAIDIFKGKVMAVIMTGMGKDGLNSSKKLKKLGGKILAQSEEDSVIYGMNRAVIEAGIVEGVYTIPELAKAIANN